MLQVTNNKHTLNQLRTLLCLLLIFSTCVFSGNSEQSFLDTAINQAKEKNLWEKNEWLNLLHYNKESGHYVSQVDDSRFFYATDGRKNPQTELIETLKHLLIKTKDDNQQTQCRFIARTKWLSKQLKLDTEQFPTVHCSEYLKWRELTQSDSVTMIFPAYHLNSPSSMFGHTLLRLDNSKNPQSEWLSFAVNFGANITSDDNSLIYAYRGLVGGYPGTFITEPYFKKIQEYNRIEHRDIWEYKLNLTSKETQIMINHLWELKTINFDYYFFDENCSYRLLELLEVARPGIELTEDYILTAIPVDTVRTIEQAQLIESVNYRPARATKIQYALASLPKEQQQIVLQSSENINTLQSDSFAQLQEKEKKTIIDLAYKYLRYKTTKEKRETATAKRSHQLLSELNRYPVDISINNTISTPTAPEKAHKSKRADFTFGQRLNNNYAEFGFKMAFHDLEDNKDGFLQGAQINIGSIKFRAEDNVGLRLYRLDFVDIFSLTPKNKFFNPLSWKVNTGFERQLTNNKDQLIYQLNGGAGGTWEILKNHQFYTLATARMEINEQLKRALEPAIGFNAGFLSHFKHTTARLEFSGEQFLDNIYRLRVQYIQNFVLSTNHSIKLFAKHQWQENNTEYSDVNFSYQYYF
ncbi:putative outermembrane protein [hydrothermal vent metagenome]|uniref:Putative outermembrane protein n=1 Tax=hydrothermal vent metagenome TaxID=652676 RepID=A0A3B0W5B3_9ZZZZ